MHVEFSRNAASALLRLIKILRAGPTVNLQSSVADIPHQVAPFPITFVFGEPSERTIPFDWWGANPFASFLGGIETISAVAANMEGVDIHSSYTCEIGMGGIAGQTITFKRSLTDKLDLMVFERDRIDLGSLFGRSMCNCTMLQEFLAAHFGIPVGVYSHIVPDVVAQQATLPKVLKTDSPYDSGTVAKYEMIQDSGVFLRDARMLASEGVTLGIKDPFVRHVAVPLYNAFKILHTGDDVSRFALALEAAGRCRASDWRYCCQEFVRRITQQYLMDLVPPEKQGLMN